MLLLQSARDNLCLRLCVHHHREGCAGEEVCAESEGGILKAGQLLTWGWLG